MPKSALTELDDVIRRLNAGQDVDRLQLTVLFAPTGPIQEVSVSSGWGYEFLTLSGRFDSALGD